jgi:hypothetical protein
VELGPSKTLVNMAQKTLKRKIASGERSMDSHVEFLASTQDTKELCYEYDMPISMEKDGTEEEQPALKTSPPLIKSAETTTPPSSAPAAATVTVDDVPITGEEIVRTLVARKLKKPIAQIQTSKSVKELCGGAYLVSQ